jgi:acetyltransferase-like isoleucine patch superfamily enzyme
MINRRDMPHYIRIIGLGAKEWLSTGIMQIFAHYWGVSLGKECRFVGLTSFVRCRQSRIDIGPGGRFLSATKANRHGLNRPVMISTLRPGAEIVIGQNAGFSGTVICAAVSIRIGNRVMLGANTTITDTDSHPIDYRERSAAHYGFERRRSDMATQVRAVIIEDDVFVGMHSIILKGVTIGRGAVVAAGSVVTKDVPPGAIVGGVPARTLHKQATASA